MVYVRGAMPPYPPLQFLKFEAGFNPISHGGGGLKTAPPCEKLKYFFGHNRL